MPAVPGILSIKMIVKKHHNGARLILAACDDNLLGQKIEDDTKIIDCSSDFYNGEKISKEDFVILIGKAYMVNAVGKETTNILADKKFANNTEIKFISGVPYINILFG